MTSLNTLKVHGQCVFFGTIFFFGFLTKKHIGKISEKFFQSVNLISFANFFDNT
jgi:hypothetical protein